MYDDYDPSSSENFPEEGWMTLAGYPVLPAGTPLVPRYARLVPLPSQET